MELKDIKDLLRFVAKLDIKDFELEDGDMRLHVSKPGIKNIPKVASSGALAEGSSALDGIKEDNQEDAVDENISGIIAPIVGTFYEASSPTSDPFVREGDSVKKGHTLCIIEAMKIMNEIEAEYDCKVIKILGVNGQPVEYGERIFNVEPL